MKWTEQVFGLKLNTDIWNVPWVVGAVVHLFAAGYWFDCAVAGAVVDVAADVFDGFVGFASCPICYPLGRLQSRTHVLDMEWHNRRRHQMSEEDLQKNMDLALPALK